MTLCAHTQRSHREKSCNRQPSKLAAVVSITLQSPPFKLTAYQGWEVPKGMHNASRCCTLGLDCHINRSHDLVCEVLWEARGRHLLSVLHSRPLSKEAHPTSDRISTGCRSRLLELQILCAVLQRGRAHKLHRLKSGWYPDNTSRAPGIQMIVFDDVPCGTPLSRITIHEHAESSQDPDSLKHTSIKQT